DLQEDGVGVAVRIGGLPDSSMIATRVGTIRRVLCGSPAHFATHGMPRHPKELSTRDCITFAGLMSADSWTFRAGKSDVAVAIRSKLVVNTAEAAIDAAVAGIGVTRVLSYQVATAVRSGTLALALQNFEPAPSPVNLVHAGQPLMPVKLRAFLDFAAPRLRQALLQADPETSTPDRRTTPLLRQPSRRARSAG
ncbi:MAG: hypothetical protein IBJ17_22285, partial [Reyranella sp.]|nr:hypothetical protein [Reyranella sp.]